MSRRSVRALRLIGILSLILITSHDVAEGLTRQTSAFAGGEPDVLPFGKSEHRSSSHLGKSRVILQLSHTARH